MYTVAEKDRPAFCLKASKYLSDFLNTKVTFNEVLDELFLMDLKMESANPVLRQYVEDLIKHGMEEKAFQKEAKRPAKDFFKDWLN